MPGSNFILTETNKKEIAAAIREAEENTIGEIRVFLEKKCDKDVLDRSLEVFEKLKMTETKLQTGVLIYIAHQDKQFAIIGDKGIHEKVPSTFWDDVKEQMQNHFAAGNFITGITEAIFLSGNHLTKHFPIDGSNPNELSNEVVINDD